MHKTVSEALERMLFLRFIGEKHCGLPDGLAQICADRDLYTSSTETICLLNMKLSANQERKLGEGRKGSR